MQIWLQAPAVWRSWVQPPKGSQRRMFTLGLPEGNCIKPLQNVSSTYVPIYVASYLRTLYLCANLCGVISQNSLPMWHHISELCTYVPIYVASYLRALYLCANLCGVISQDSVPMCQFMWRHISELCTYVPIYVASYLRTL